MRRSLLVLFVCLGTLPWSLFAQNCVPDPQYADSTGFVFPPPYHPVEEPEGGIPVKACIGNYFEFQWTINTPDSVLFPVAPGFELTIALEYLKLSTSGAISNLPEGISYICNPPDCQFNVGQLGCVLLYGTPTANNAPGSYDLFFTGQLRTKSLGVLNVNFPDPNLYPGNYFLEVLEAGDPQCFSSIDPSSGTFLTSRMVPNPVTDQAHFEVEALRDGTARLEVFDATGRPVHAQPLRLLSGFNRVALEAHALQSGFWFYRLETEDGHRTSGSFIVTSR